MPHLCQQHFLDLCDLLGQPKPAEVGPNGTWCTFEKGVEKTDGGEGFADAWMQGKFGWEYKGKHRNLNAAYQQLLKHREALENRRFWSPATWTGSRPTLTSPAL